MFENTQRLYGDIIQMFKQCIKQGVSLEAVFCAASAIAMYELITVDTCVNQVIMFNYYEMIN